MKEHLTLGNAGESLAADWLEQHGYTVLVRNFRWGKTEIDIVATRGEWLHVVEVKTSSSATWGPPEQRVHSQKMNVLRRAAGVLLQLTKRKWMQYDVIAITWKKGEAPLIELIEDVT
ncbi:MAG: YraN family protein [Sphingomonadales bacterium]